MIMDWKKIAQGTAEAGIGAITGGVGGAIGSGLSGLLGSIFGDSTPSQKDIMDWQEKMLEKQFAFNKQEAALNRDFQKSMMEAAQQWNSIGAQMQRAQAAGVNPFSLVNNSGYQALGSSAMASGSQASSASGMTPGIPSSLDAQRFNLIAAAMQSISQSSLNDSQKNAIDTKLVAELRKTIAEGDIADADAKIKQLVANDPRLSDFVTAFFVKAREEAESAAARTDYIKDLSDLVKQDKNLRFLQGKIKKEHWEIVQPLLQDYYQGVIDKNTAQTRLVNEQADTEPYKRGNLAAQSNLFNAQALTEETKQDLNDAYAASVRLDTKIRDANSADEISSNLAEFRATLRRVGLINDQMETDIKAQEQEMKLKPLQEFRSWVFGVVHSYANVISAIRGGGTSTPADFTDVTATYPTSDGGRHTTHTRRYVKSR